MIGDLLAFAVIAAAYWLVVHPLREQSADMASLERERRKLDALHNIDRRRRNAPRIGEEVRQ